MSRTLQKIAILLSLNLALTVAVRAQTVKVKDKHTVIDSDKSADIGVGGFPDSSMGAFQLNGTNYVFGASAFDRTTLELTSVDLNSLKSDLQHITTIKAIPKGGPNDFDRNYAGGGAVYYDADSGILIHMYHGEFWYGPGSDGPSYSALGLVYSTDLGANWTKLGEVISPQTTRSGRCQVDTGVGTLVPRPDGYLYTYYDDEGAGCDGHNFNVAVARAKISDVIAAARAGTPFKSGPGALFQKYYQGGFTENGVMDLANPQNGGGNFSPVLTGSLAWAVNVAWSNYLSEWVIAYAAGWKGIAIRFSPDGINWGAATRVVRGGGEPPDAIFYPSLLNTDGGDPQVLGQRFYVYYVDPFGDWSQTSLKRVQVTVSGNPPAPIPNAGIAP